MPALRLAIVLAALSLMTTAAAAQTYSMVALIEGERQGPLTCGNTARGQEGSQLLLGFSDEYALDAPSGGTVVQTKPLTVIKEIDQCSPPLFKAMVSRERLSRVHIRLFDRRGIHFFTVRLEGAQVTRIARNVRQHGLHEEVAFVFRTIELIDHLTGASAAHDFPG
jgi:type VI secretion system Hcp family effector